MAYLQKTGNNGAETEDSDHPVADGESAASVVESWGGGWGLLNAGWGAGGWSDELEGGVGLLSTAAVVWLIAGLLVALALLLLGSVAGWCEEDLGVGWVEGGDGWDESGAHDAWDTGAGDDIAGRDDGGDARGAWDNRGGWEGGRDTGDSRVRHICGVVFCFVLLAFVKIDLVSLP